MVTLSRPPRSSQRPDLPHTGRAAALNAELACERGRLADLRFLGVLAFDCQEEKRNYTRPLTGRLPRFEGITGPGLRIRHAGWLPDDVASVDEEVDAGHE